MSPPAGYTNKSPQNIANTTSRKRGVQVKPSYLILQQTWPNPNMSNSVACVFDNIGSKCKMMSRFKISACAGMATFYDSIKLDIS